jgi:uroporphyrinogen decarboxylase
MKTERMSSRQRVLCAFNRIPADRVPIDYLANPGIDGRMKRHFGLDPNDHEGLKQALHVDFRGIGARYKGPKLYEDLPNGVVVDDWGIHRRYVEHGSGGYWDYCDFPLREADEETVANWKMPDPGDFDYSTVAEQCRRYDQYALAIHCYGDLINGNGMLRGMEQTLVDLLLDDPAGLLLADRRFAVQAEIARRTLEAAKGRIDIFWLGEDLGTQDRQMISMSIFQKHIRPRFQKLVDLAKAYGCRTMIHTCGSSSWAYQDFIEMGIEAVDTLQPECKNMSPRYLVDTFGGRLSFHGCISTAGKVTSGTPEEVRQEVKDTLGVMMPACSYMLSPTHELQDNSPTQNVAALYQAAIEYGFYE